MISITGKRWKEKFINKNSINKLKQDLKISDILARLIILRNFSEEEIFSINNNLLIKNVFKNNSDYNNAITVITESIKNKENICILGDYDVDGSAASSLIIRFLKSINHPYFFYIPDRVNDGYGASVKLFKKLILKKPKLIIMVDCGSNSIEAVEFLKQNKIKSIIIDHHEINKPYPKANSIINPKKNNGYIQYDYLCATALVYFFLDLLIKKIKTIMNLEKYLIYVALATVCDVMPLRKLNRTICSNVIKNFKVESNKIFKEIFYLNKKNFLNLNDLGYLVGPILNSGGRLGKSSYATELLSSDDQKIITRISNELIKLNNKRKTIETSILDKINFNKINKENKKIIFFYDPYMSEGLIGIIAARLKEYFNKPSIVITSSGKILKGSVRSTNNYNVGKAIKNALDNKIIEGGGGHSMAAGFILKKKQIKKFQNFILKDYLKNNPINEETLFYDSEISSSAINNEFYDNIKKIEPFGAGNPSPLFLLKELKIIKTTVLKNKHISVIFKSKSGKSLNSIAFNSINNKIGEYLLNYKKNLNVLAKINKNFWNNKSLLQLTIRDIIL